MFGISRHCPAPLAPAPAPLAPSARSCSCIELVFSPQACRGLLWSHFAWITRHAAAAAAAAAGVAEPPAASGSSSPSVIAGAVASMHKPLCSETKAVPFSALSSSNETAAFVVRWWLPLACLGKTNVGFRMKTIACSHLPSRPHQEIVFPKDKNTTSFECFPYVCPEPVLVKQDDFLVLKGKNGALLTLACFPWGPSVRRAPGYANTNGRAGAARNASLFGVLCLSRACLGKLIVF